MMYVEKAKLYVRKDNMLKKKPSNTQVRKGRK